MYITIWLVNSSLYFYLISSQCDFSNRKNSGVREEVSYLKKSLCKNILLVSSRLCTSSLVRAPPQLTLFISSTTPSTPRHMRGRQLPTLEIWQSPGNFTGKRITQIKVFIFLIRTARLALPSLADELLHSEEDKDTSATMLPWLATTAS